jgi:hypothetical protein
VEIEYHEVPLVGTGDPGWWVVEPPTPEQISRGLVWGLRDGPYDYESIAQARMDQIMAGRGGKSGLQAAKTRGGVSSSNANRNAPSRPARSVLDQIEKNNPYKGVK